MTKSVTDAIETEDAEHGRPGGRQAGLVDVDEDAVSMVYEMTGGGFSMDVCRGTLIATGGNIERVINRLFENQPAPPVPLKPKEVAVPLVEIDPIPEVKWESTPWLTLTLTVTLTLTLTLIGGGM